MSLPPPRVEECDGFLVVRDDEVPGGTKRRVLPGLLTRGREYVYASPAYGYAQVALAHACYEVGGRATVFTAQRREPHARTAEAVQAGAKVVPVPHGYLNVVQAAARRYCEQRGAELLPFGLDDPRFVELLADVARQVKVRPKQVWTVAGSGTLTRALQLAWPKADFRAVRVGRPPDAGRAFLYDAPEKFEQDARDPPPFPSCSNYDAKAWQFVKAHAQPGALFWNVAA